MNALIENLASQHAAELREEGAQRRRAARHSRRRGSSSPRRREGAAADYGRRLAGYRAQLTIRRLSGRADRLAVERVAERDSAPVPDGELLGAELDGHLVAAMSLDDGRVVADPFARSAEAVVLLRRRGEQVRTAARRKRRLPGLGFLRHRSP